MNDFLSLFDSAGGGGAGAGARARALGLTPGSARVRQLRATAGDRTRSGGARAAARNQLRVAGIRL